MTSLARALLYVSLALGGITFVAPPAQAASVCAKKKKKKAKKAASKKITAATLIKWRKSGMTDDEIVAKAQAADYVMSSKDKAALKKAKAKSLIAAFSSGEEEEPVEEVAATPAKKPINLSDITNPEDIDFDSVPPPSGVPQEHVQKSTTPDKKKLDTSVRPAAPFEEEKVVASAAKPAKKQPAQAQPAARQPAQDAAPKKRVVYTAASQ